MARIREALGTAVAAGLIVVSVSMGQGQPAGQGEKRFEMDTIATKTGELKITFIGHATLMFDYGGKVVHVDPWTRLADYSKLPKADLVLITHEHQDHLDVKAVATVRGENTKVVLTKACADKVPGGIVMKNGDVQTVQGFKVEAVPAYNIVQKRPDGQPFGDYRVKSASGKTYRVAMRGPGRMMHWAKVGAERIWLWRWF